MHYAILHQLKPRHRAQLLSLYRGEWWSRDRTEADVARMLDGADVVVVGVVEPASDTLVGFTRVLTDGIFKAMVFDVIVAPARRGEGIGRMLLEAALAHDRVRDVEHVELYCRPEHVPLYEKWGFARVPADLCFMRRARTNRAENL
jgi:GNAT superfamily N-acetyltransferase